MLILCSNTTLPIPFIWPVNAILVYLMCVYLYNLNYIVPEILVQGNYRGSIRRSYLLPWYYIPTKIKYKRYKLLVTIVTAHFTPQNAGWHHEINYKRPNKWSDMKRTVGSTLSERNDKWYHVTDTTWQIPRQVILMTPPWTR